MTEQPNEVEMIDPVTGEILNDQTLAERVVTDAKTTGTDLLGPDGALGQLTKNVLEIALEEEMTDHLGYPKHGTSDGSNARNGTRSKTVLTDIGPVQIAVPRDTAGTFTPKIVKKRQRRLSGVDEMVLSLTAHGMTTGEVSAYFAEIYGASVSKDTVSKITDKVIEEMTGPSAMLGHVVGDEPVSFSFDVVGAGRECSDQLLGHGRDLPGRVPIPAAFPALPADTESPS